MMLTFAAGLVAVSASGVHETGDALSLLQTSSSKFSELSSSKDCKAAKAAHKAAKTKMKTDKTALKAARKAVKDARAAVKAAKVTKSQSEKATEKTYADMLKVCPIPEVDADAPDEGCSADIVTSYRPGQGRDILNPANCNSANALSNYLDGFTKCLPGGGVPEGKGQPYGSKLGIAIMQPCSVAWTTGAFISPRGTLGDGKRAGQVMYMQKLNLRNQCACLDWAKSVMPWPESFAVTFKSNGGTTSTCQVHKKTNIEWKDFGPSLQLSANVANNAFTCYMGNPAEWKQRYQQEKSANQLIDKCSKPEWSRWLLTAAEPPISKSGTPFKSLWTGSGINGGTINIKDCYKAAKAEPACANAVALSWSPNHNGWCKCIFQTPSFEGNSRGNIDNYVCMM